MLGTPKAASGSDDGPNATTSWKDWAGREEQDEAYHFGDFSRGVLKSMQKGFRDLKHRGADIGLSVLETHEQRAVDYVRSIVAEDDSVKEIAESTVTDDAVRSSTAERFWVGVCKDSHSDHKQEYDDASPTRSSQGSLRVELVSFASEPPLRRSDGTIVSKPVAVVSLGSRRSGGLRFPGAPAGASCVSSALFQVRELAGSDLAVYLFDKGSSKFEMGLEDQSFCGGCLVPLSLLLQHCMGTDLRSSLRDSWSQRHFSADLTLHLLPLALMRAKSKLEPGELSGVKTPQASHGQITLKLTLELTEPPQYLYLRPADPCKAEKQTLADHKGHVSNPLSVLKAAAHAVGRAGFALKMDAWKQAANELRDAPLLSLACLFWWSLVMIWAPVFTWPLLSAAMFPLFAWKVKEVGQRVSTEERRRLYMDEDGETSKELMKGAIKVQLNIMQLTENVNKAASQLEKMKFLMNLEDRCLSCTCGLFVLLAALCFSATLLLISWLLQSGAWRYLVWIPGLCVLLPSALRVLIFEALGKIMELRQQLLGDELERVLAGFWQRIPDGVEAAHLQLCKRYVFEGC